VKDVSTQGKWNKTDIAAEVERFDWSHVDALTDRDIESAADADPNGILPSEAALESADLVIPANARAKRKQAAE
jgi:hypothetical protein